MGVAGSQRGSERDTEEKGSGMLGSATVCAGSTQSCMWLAALSQRRSVGGVLGCATICAGSTQSCMWLWVQMAEVLAFTPLSALWDGSGRKSERKPGGDRSRAAACLVVPKPAHQSRLKKVLGESERKREEYGSRAAACLVLRHNLHGQRSVLMECMWLWVQMASS